MTESKPTRRAALRAGVTTGAAAAVAVGVSPAAEARGERGDRRGPSVGSRRHEFSVRDAVYQNHGGKPRLARIYQPAGEGPFPGVLQVHGGAWNNKDRTDGQHTSLELCAAGIVVAAIDFRNAPEAPYPASLADVNLGLRWLKAHAREFGSAPDRVGLYGTSSGGHQALLAAIRPDDPRYRALALPEAPGMDAKAAFVVSGWGVLFPLERMKIAASKNKADVVENHKTFFHDEATQIEATPALIIERGEKVYLPPAHVFQGTKDAWTPVPLAEQLANAWRKAGGSFELALYEGEQHTFVNDHPFSDNSLKAIEAVKAFIKRHGGQQHAAR